MAISDVVRTRFAPSPTGFVHVGGLRTALYNYLFAKKNGGKFILRIEDTDQTRLVEGAAENIEKILEWAGLTPDESPLRGGDYGPYTQSQRLDIYKRYCEQLIAEKKAYYCFSTPEELEEVRKLQQKQGLQPKYNRKWLPESMGGSMPESKIKEALESGIPKVVRMKVPDGVAIKVHDAIRGVVEFDSAVVDDQVLLKADGFPTYHLAVVVDDHLMKITHVIRGEEWLSSTPKHVLLYEFFGWEMPVFAHVPLLLNPDRTKLSKRQGDVAVEDYVKKGFSREALLNFVALLGWNPGGGSDQEIFTLDELIERFSLEHVGKSGAIFNLDKLQWIEEQHIRRKSDAELAQAIRPILEEELKTRKTEMPIEKITSDDYLKAVAREMKERVRFVKEFVTFSSYFFFEPETYEEDAVKKRWKENTNALLLEFVARLETLSDFSASAIEAELRAFCEAKGIKTAEMVHPIRLAVSGASFGPSLFHILEIIGKEAVIRRVKRAVERLKAEPAAA
ncbi:MAG: glutamate--tRNA ligase [Chloroherpetonaceae bacterium]|nr:glutamate--tRNA ligase [Chloroherpetonaceae bacterium]MDW8437506.1 glutamate--tRNA ligase [Chloroherpetonaceae bacterium]